MPRYIYPPRPGITLPPTALNFEESRNLWLWQRKFDGDRCVAIVENARVYLANRHGKFHSPSKFPHLQKELLSLKIAPGTTCLDGELLSDQTLVLFDVLQYSKYLFGMSQVERLELLTEICGNPQSFALSDAALQVTEHIWLAIYGFSEFTRHFSEFLSKNNQPNRIVEGIILRKKLSILDNYGNSPYEVNWMIRSRYPHKNYRF
jgi:ATP-dependent DNA ligase